MVEVVKIIAEKVEI